MIKHRAIAAACFALAMGASVGGSLAQGCLSRSEGRSLMEQGQVLPLPEAMRRAGVSGDVVDAQLCAGGGGYVYRVRVRQGGDVKPISIPAS